MRRICAFEVLGTIVVIGVLATLFLPPVCDGHARGQVRCAHNLAELYKLGTVYAASHKGQWPEPGKGNYWHAFAETTPPYVGPEELDILRCPFREKPDGGCDYRGPKVPWSSLRMDDPIAVCRRGNHGERDPLNVLFKHGSVMEVELDDPRWKGWNELLGP